MKNLKEGVLENSSENNRDRERAIERLQQGHDHLAVAVNSLVERGLVEAKIVKEWTVKEILGHLSAWNQKQKEAIDNILINRDSKEWWIQDENEFNKTAIESRSEFDLAAIISEWEQSFREMIARIEQLSDEDWFSIADKKEEGLPVSIAALFSYEYRSETHEGGHARQIEEFIEQQEK